MHYSNPIDHANHELTLIAGNAAGDLADSEHVRAEALLPAFTSCAELQRDHIAIAAATRALPAAALGSRDFRLDAAQAERLRRGSWLRTLLRPFGAAQSSVRPIATAFTSLGVAGLLVATILPGLLGSPASAPMLERAAAGTAAPGPTSLAARPVAGGGSTDAGEVQAAGQSSPPRFGNLTGARASQDADDMPRDVAVGAPGSHVPAPVGASADETSLIAPAPDPFVVGSLALLAIGAALFGLRFAARRVR
jgi:hypothetical protein